MELHKAVQGRRSIRQFLPKPVSEEMIEDVIQQARWAPSWGNTQVWETLVVTGEPLERFKTQNHEALISGKASKPDISMPHTWEGLNKKRYQNLGRSVLESLSIAREDKDKRLQNFGEMFQLFDAPALTLIMIDMKHSVAYAMLDAGLFLQNFCLLAWEQGLGTCILAATVMYPEVAREVFSIPADKVLVIGAAVGWPDLEAPVNCFERERASLEEFVRWIK